METIGKEEQTLFTLLEQDREMVMSQLTQDRAQENAVPVLEKEVDRLMYTAGALEVVGLFGRQIGLDDGAKAADVHADFQRRCA